MEHPSSAWPADPPSPADAAPLHATRSPTWVRVGLAMVLAIYVAYSSFGVAAPFLWGHNGYHGATYMQRARTSLRFHMVTPANWAGYDKPIKAAWYLHHPIGYHHILTALIPILGSAEWVARSVAAAGGLLLLWALFVLVRRWWSPPAALLASAVYVGLPILCSFSILSDPMLLAMACTIATVDVFLRYLERPQGRLLVLACILYILGGLLMWEAYFQALFHGLFALAWLTTRPGRKRIWRLPAGLTWFWVTGLAAAATMAFHLIFTWKIGVLPDFLESYGIRHSANAAYVISQHKKWFELLYGWPVIYLGLIWIGLFTVRAILKRARARDQAVWIFFLINTLYIYLFAQGSSVHLYRVFWYSGFFALAITDLVVDLRAAVAWALKRWPQIARIGATVTAGAAVIAYFAVETPHAYHNLLESRVMMGTHGQADYRADYPLMRFAMEASKRFDKDYFFLIHSKIPDVRIEFHYYTDRSSAPVYSIGQVERLAAQHPHSVFLTMYPPAPSEREALRALMARHPSYLYDHQFLIIDLSSDQPEFHEYAFAVQRPSWSWWWFVSHHYPPLKTKEVSTTTSACILAALGSAPLTNTPEADRPIGNRRDLQLCYHNYQVLRGQTQAANAYLAEMTRPLARLSLTLRNLGQVVALGPTRRQGMDVWLSMERIPSKKLYFYWSAQRLDASHKLYLGNQPAAGDPAPWEAKPGYIYIEPLRWSLPPGPYRITLETSEKPPLPGPVVERHGAALDLGQVDIP